MGFCAAGSAANANAGQCATDTIASTNFVDAWAANPAYCALPGPADNASVVAAPFNYNNDQVCGPSAAAGTYVTSLNDFSAPKGNQVGSVRVWKTVDKLHISLQLEPIRRPAVSGNDMQAYLTWSGVESRLPSNQATLSIGLRGNPTTGSDPSSNTVTDIEFQVRSGAE